MVLALVGCESVLEEILEAQEGDLGENVPWDVVASVACDVESTVVMDLPGPLDGVGVTVVAFAEAYAVEVVGAAVAPLPLENPPAALSDNV